MYQVKLFILMALIATYVPISATQFTTASGKDDAFNKLESSTWSKSKNLESIPMHSSSSQVTIALNKLTTRQMNKISSESTQSDIFTTAEIFPLFSQTSTIAMPLTVFDSRTNAKELIASTTSTKTTTKKPTPSSLETISLLDKIATTEQLQQVTLKEMAIASTGTKGLSSTKSFLSVTNKQTASLPVSLEYTTPEADSAIQTKKETNDNTQSTLSDFSAQRRTTAKQNTVTGLVQSDKNEATQAFTAKAETEQTIYNKRTNNLEQTTTPKLISEITKATLPETNLSKLSSIFAVTNETLRTQSKQPTNNETLNPTAFAQTSSSKDLKESEDLDKTTMILKNSFQTTNTGKTLTPPTEETTVIFIGDTEKIGKLVTKPFLRETSDITDQETIAKSTTSSKTEAETIHAARTVEPDFTVKVTNETEVSKSQSSSSGVNETFTSSRAEVMTATKIPVILNYTDDSTTLKITEILSPLTSRPMSSNEVTENETLVTSMKVPSTELMGLQGKTPEYISTRKVKSTTKPFSINESTKSPQTDNETEKVSEIISGSGEYTATDSNFTSTQILDASEITTTFVVSPILNVVEENTVRTETAPNKIQTVSLGDAFPITDSGATSTYATNNQRTVVSVNTTPQPNASVSDATMTSFPRFSPDTSKLPTSASKEPTTELSSLTKFIDTATLDPSAFTLTSSPGIESNIFEKTTVFSKSSLQTTDLGTGTEEIFSEPTPKIQSTTVLLTELIGNVENVGNSATTSKVKETSEITHQETVVNSTTSSKTEAETIHAARTVEPDFTVEVTNETQVSKSQSSTSRVNETFTSSRAEVLTATKIPVILNYTVDSTTLKIIEILSPLTSMSSDEVTENEILVTSMKVPLTELMGPQAKTSEYISSREVKSTTKPFSINESTKSPQTDNKTEKTSETVGSSGEYTATDPILTSTQILNGNETTMPYVVSPISNVIEENTVLTKTAPNKILTVSSGDAFPITDSVATSTYATNNQQTTVSKHTTPQPNTSVSSGTMSSFTRSAAVNPVRKFVTDLAALTSGFPREITVAKLSSKYVTTDSLAAATIHTTQQSSATLVSDTSMLESTANTTTSNNITSSRILVESEDSTATSGETTTSALLSTNSVSTLDETLTPFATSFHPKRTTFNDIRSTALPPSSPQTATEAGTTRKLFPRISPVTIANPTTTDSNEETTNIQTASPKAIPTSTVIKILSNFPDRTNAFSVNPTITLLIQASAITFTKNQEETQSNPKKEPPESSQGLSAGIIAAIVIAILIFIIALACLIASRKRKRTGSLNFPLNFKRGDKNANSSSRSAYTSF